MEMIIYIWEKWDKHVTHIRLIRYKHLAWFSVLPDFVLVKSSLDTHLEATLFLLHLDAIIVSWPSTKQIIGILNPMRNKKNKKLSESENSVQPSQFHLELNGQHSWILLLYSQFQSQTILQLLKDPQLICAPIQTEEPRQRRHAWMWVTKNYIQLLKPKMHF